MLLVVYLPMPFLALAARSRRALRACWRRCLTDAYLNTFHRLPRYLSNSAYLALYLLTYTMPSPANPYLLTSLHGGWTPVELDSRAGQRYSAWPPWHGLTTALKDILCCRRTIVCAFHTCQPRPAATDGLCGQTDV